MKFDKVLARRMKNVLTAAGRAQNPLFKEMWLKKFDQLFLTAE